MPWWDGTGKLQQSGGILYVDRVCLPVRAIDGIQEKMGPCMFSLESVSSLLVVS